MTFTVRLRHLLPSFGFRLLSSVLLLGLAGCSLVPQPKPDPTRYYVLTGGSLSDAGEQAAEGSLVLGVKRIEIAPYLNGKDMVVREAGNEIAYQNFARWAEPLTTSIGRTLAGNLARSGKVNRVYPQPFPFEVERDYDVSVRVLRCEGERKAGGQTVASFSALVEVTEAKTGGAVVLRKVFVAPEAGWDGRDFGKLATALSEGVLALGAEVVAALPAK
ncbi:MAG: hypothetical protein K0R17_381 [Rariglobus sp.]|jgi:uncharacterized lipoprotein YmbA|nr:hypothetical protein [Rariglobus sp.]